MGILNIVQPKQKSHFIDVLKGWAMLSVIVVNYLLASVACGGFMDQKDEWASVIVFIFSDAAWSILAVLFGYGMHRLFIQYQFLPFHQQRHIIMRRILSLFIIGLINIAFFWGDILHDYALVSLMVWPFLNIRPKILIHIFLLFFLFINPVSISIVNQYLAYGFINPHLYGEALVKEGFWNHVSINYEYFFASEITDPSYMISVHLHMFAMMLLGVLLSKVSIKSVHSLFLYLKTIFRRVKQKQHLLFYYFFLFFGVVLLVYYSFYDISFIVSTCILSVQVVLLFLFSNSVGIISPVKAIGAMSLTAYLSQNVLMIFLFWNVDWGFQLRLSLKEVMLMALIIYFLQAWLCYFWLKKYRYGPVEWLWRSFNYYKWIPNRKDS